jgi:hypothetical protein
MLDVYDYASIAHEDREGLLSLPFMRSFLIAPNERHVSSELRTL